MATRLHHDLDAQQDIGQEMHREIRPPNGNQNTNSIPGHGHHPLSNHTPPPHGKPPTGCSSILSLPTTKHGRSPAPAGTAAGRITQRRKNRNTTRSANTHGAQEHRTGKNSALHNIPPVATKRRNPSSRGNRAGINTRRPARNTTGSIRTTTKHQPQLPTTILRPDGQTSATTCEPNNTSKTTHEIRISTPTNRIQRLLHTPAPATTNGATSRNPPTNGRQPVFSSTTPQ